MISRRRFLQSSASLALLPLLPKVARSATLRVRPSWDVFCAGPSFLSFCNALRTMRANKDSTDPNAWTYWSETHRQFCPHGKPYFLAWHRGFLYRFEARVRQISGDPTLVLPYWNYYDNPNVPVEFLDPTSPLYRGDRTGTDVSSGLSLDAFADTIIYFQRGKPDAFESTIEPRPHNNVHNLIGGAMSSILTSPRDPLFWVHHANIDRLWVAWLAAGNGRRQPAASNTYWSGDFSYGAGIKSVPAVWTTSTTTYLGYQYDNQTMPTTLPPPPPPTSSAMPVAPVVLGTSSADARPDRPPTVQRMALGSTQPLVLDERSINIDVPLSPQEANRIRSLMLSPAAASGTPEALSPLRVVLDGVKLTGLGEKGGYFYNVFLDLPAAGEAGAPASTYLIGTLGAFEISVAQMQANMGAGGMHDMAGMSSSGTDRDVTIVFPIADALRRIWPTGLERVTISFVRVNGRKHPTRGDVIRVRAFSVVAQSTP